MLVLSILIMLALGAAVVSFFIAGAQWLLLLSAALVLFAFYLSRRTPSSGISDDPIRAPIEPWTPVFPATSSDEPLPESGRHRGADIADEPHDNNGQTGDDRPDHDLRGISRLPVRPTNGHAIAS